VRDGRVLDSFVGVLPESALREWIERLLPTRAETLAAEAGRIETNDPSGAESRYREALGLEPENLGVKIGLARALVHLNRFDEARAILVALQARGYLEPEAESVKAELELRTQASGAGTVETLRASLAEKPGDPGLRVKLAEALAASQAYAESLELALGVVEDEHGETRDEARRVMLNVFQLLPPDSELSVEYRRRLSAALY
jgi:putative thioredoxin